METWPKIFILEFLNKNNRKKPQLHNSVQTITSIRKINCYCFYYHHFWFYYK